MIRFSDSAKHLKEESGVKTRLLLAAVGILALPMWFSPSKGDSLKLSAPFATVAYAGHTLAANWCECGAPGCICDLGETGGSPRPLSNATAAETSGKALCAWFLPMPASGTGILL
jgi:hypothetical protein